jgi:aspartyl protease family protein
MSAGHTLFWAGALLIGATLLASVLPGSGGPPEMTAPALNKAAAPTVMPPPRAGNGIAGQVLQRAGDGHFYAEAQVNGARVRFLVDTGASLVALTGDDARRAGIAVGDASGRALGAGGEIAFAPVTIDRLAIGPIEARGVRGAVVRELPVSLLGQSFLSRVGGVEINGDVMTLR